jgi:hypothetical protein
MAISWLYRKETVSNWAYSTSMVRSKSAIAFFVRMESAPGVLARILEPFVVIGLPPSALILRQNDEGSAFAAVEFEGLDDQRATLLVERLKQMPCVHSVRIRFADSVAAKNLSKRFDARRGTSCRPPAVRRAEVSDCQRVGTEK